MKDPYRQPEPCDVHELHPHDHSHVPVDLRAGRCSGRFWCTACWRWFGGEECKPLAVKPTA